MLETARSPPEASLLVLLRSRNRANAGQVGIPCLSLPGMRQPAFRRRQGQCLLVYSNIASKLGARGRPPDKRYVKVFARSCDAKLQGSRKVPKVRSESDPGNGSPHSDATARLTFNGPFLGPENGPQNRPTFDRQRFTFAALVSFLVGERESQGPTSSVGHARPARLLLRMLCADALVARRVHVPRPCCETH